MSTIPTITRSLRTARLTARAPRIAALSLACVLIIAGLRATFAGPAEPAPAPVAPTVAADQGAATFAEGFARAYLTWEADSTERRDQALAPYAATIDAGGGLQPAPKSSQKVVWTAVVGARKSQNVQLITVAAQTNDRLLYLSVPVARDQRGLLSIANYPALIGPPATNRQAPTREEDPVDDDALIGVAERALRNYLAIKRNDLLADLTPDARVSLPSAAMTLVNSSSTTWVARPRRVAIEARVRDERGTNWTLRYELDVRKRDRWYVRSVQADPTFRGDRS